MDSVTLWKAASATHWWMVDASVQPNGDLSICSGDTGREWYAIVRAHDLEALRLALDGGQTDRSISILSLLARRFGGEADIGPFEKIKSFLNDEGIMWESQTW